MAHRQSSATLHPVLPHTAHLPPSSLEPMRSAYVVVVGGGGENLTGID